ncbi:protein MAIN-LIKE 1-like [Vicia villosa]|uniref:protein MAIN-LIKE 1-like n=1 Tax=Vicia villosa TaxID=3911 RepID=UPI00273C7BDD|nr:protein MAIN-LIKE 1-like [Vicia villosa]
MGHQPKIETGSGSSDHLDLEDMSIQELVSVLRTAFLTEDFDRVEEVLVRRDKRLQTEILRLQEMVELEKLTRFQAEEDLRNREELCEKGKRAQNNYEKLLKEVKKNTNLADRDIIGELRKKNNELELEVCELRKLKEKWVDETNALAQLRIRVGVLENNNNAFEDKDEGNVGDYEIRNDALECATLQTNEPPSKRSKNATCASSSVVKTRGRDDWIPSCGGVGRRARQTMNVEGENVDATASAPQSSQFPGGPYDTSLLVKYEHHVARHLWYGEERGLKKELKVVAHGSKLIAWVPDFLPPTIERWLSDSGLSSLQRTSLSRIDPNLISAFVERWHPETSSFHMPFGEMTITLDDVSCLLHLPIKGEFWDPPSNITEEYAIALAVDMLGVPFEEAALEVRACRGAYYKLEWMHTLFTRHRAASRFDCAARAYMMMLVGCTIFADKTFTLVEARYLLLFRDLAGCSRYSWGAAALVTLYKHLGDASMFTCKQLGGYATLLQCWIHEYFPMVGRRRETRITTSGGGLPRAMRWAYKQGELKVDELRLVLDVLTPTDVIWRPFENHRVERPFDDICLYRGCLKWCDTVVPYLPDRCIRQFGFRQYIPPPPPDCNTHDVDVKWITYHSSVLDVIRLTDVANIPYDASVGYLEWYYRVSHPRLIPPSQNE